MTKKNTKKVSARTEMKTAPKVKQRAPAKAASIAAAPAKAIKAKAASAAPVKTLTAKRKPTAIYTVLLANPVDPNGSPHIERVGRGTSPHDACDQAKVAASRVFVGNPTEFGVLLVFRGAIQALDPNSTRAPAVRGLKVAAPAKAAKPAARRSHGIPAVLC